METNIQTIRGIKNQIYPPKISNNRFLWTDCTIRSLNVTKTHVAAIIQHEKKTDVQIN